MNPGLIATIAAAAAGGAWLMVRNKVKIVDSPNKSPHTTGSWRGVVIHYTAGGSYRGAVRWFQNPESKVSAHYTVGRLGQIVQSVPLTHNAWHTGKTFSVETSNRYLVGIELANFGRLVEQNGRLFYNTGGRDNDRILPFKGDAALAKLHHKSGQVVTAWWEPYSTTQIAALIWLLGELKVQGVALDLYGHEDICRPRGRKNDPGPLFPWHLMPGSRINPQTWSETL